MAQNKLKIRDKTVFDGIFVKFFLKTIYVIWFKLSGWKPVANPPKGAGITIAAPHTSNWDIIYALGAAILFDIKIYFSIKESWCRLPLVGPFMLWMGGIPIDRSSGAKGQVALIKEFVCNHRDKRIFFLFTPEGTRGQVDKWKTGFYHVAKDCQLPIFLAKVDYRTKESGVFHSFELTDDKEQDIASIQESYSSVCAKFPDLQFPHYKGPLPEISAREAKIMQALANMKGKATQAEISARTALEGLTTEMLDFLVEKGIVEKTSSQEQGKLVYKYKLTLAGSGCLLHLPQALAGA